MHARTKMMMMTTEKKSSGGSNGGEELGDESENVNVNVNGKMDRKEMERKRRQHMRGLCLELASLIPKDHYSSTMDHAMTRRGSLDEAASYVKKLRERVEELQQKLDVQRSISRGVTREVTSTIRLDPVVEVRHDDATLDVAIITTVEEPAKLHEVITILEQEGADIISAHFSVAGDKIFYAIHSQALSSRVGIEASRVSERLRQLVGSNV